MIPKLWIVIVVLFMVATFTLKANAQQQTSSGKPQGQGEGVQLRQEIEALEQQAKPLHVQLGTTNCPWNFTFITLFSMFFNKFLCFFVFFIC